MDFIEKNDFIGLKRELSQKNEVDIAEFIEQLDSDKMVLIFRLLPKDICAEVFSYLSLEQQEHVIMSISDYEVSQLVTELFIDDAVDLLEEVPAGVVKKVLRNLNEDTRNIINQYLKYLPFTAGSIMTAEFVEFHMNTTVKDAISIIRKTALDKETVYTCYIINEYRKLEGIVPLKTLLLFDDNTLVQDIMTKNIISVSTNDDQEYVAGLIRKYGFMSIPVVDSENRLVGIVTVDDAMDIIVEENTEDFEKMAAILPSEKEYLKTGIWELAKNRIIWLLLLMLSATFTSLIMSHYENVLSTMLVLTYFVPMLTDTGGNAGSQSATLVIRGLALGEIRPRDFAKVIWKEFRVSLIVGVILSLVNFARLIFINRTTIPIAFVVCTSVFATVISAKVIGGILPIVASKLRLDPAIMASPLITTIVDTLAIIIYFAMASYVLHIA